MKHDRQETTRYTIQREFLAKITAKELVNRIIQNHVNNYEKRNIVSRS